MATITDSTDTTDLGDVQTESMKMDSGVAPMPLPDGTADTAVLIPMTGPLN